MKAIDTFELNKLPGLDMTQLLHDLRRMGLQPLMEFRKSWNNKIICQFYASYHLDTRVDTHVIHCTTEGKHYKVDFITFSHLLGLDRRDHTSTAITEISALAMDEYQYMYLDGHRANGKTVWLKPCYYVLNNILCQILYPKIGDSTNLHEDSQVVLDCFGDEFTKFSISRYIWDKIFVASEDVVKHYPYAPFIMHIIEHVSGIHFPSDAPHKVLKLSNKTSL
jgi:hypothetical protein